MVQIPTDDRVETSLSHVSYHVDRARVGLSHLARIIGRRQELSHLLNAIHDLQLCSLDTQSIAQEIIDHARTEEAVMGPKVATWRAAAKALFEINSRGPCLQGDQEFTSRLPVKHLAKAADVRRAPIFDGLRQPAVSACDTNMKMIVWSAQMEQMYGVKHSDALGLEPWDIEPSMKETGGEQRLLNAIANGTVTTLKGIPYVSNNGLYGRYDVTSRPLMGPDDNIIGCISTIIPVGPIRHAA